MLYPQFHNTDGSFLPESQAVLLKWVAWLGRVRSLQPKTIKSYVMHLLSAHVDGGLSFSACRLPMLQRVIRGIKRYMGECDCNPKLPIMREVLTCILGSAIHLTL